MTPDLLPCPLWLQVREILGHCTCPDQFPMIKVSEGKYRVGDSSLLIFVRVSQRLPWRGAGSLAGGTVVTCPLLGSCRCCGAT